MPSLWIAVRPSPTGARVLAMKGREIVLKAKLKRLPSHPRALPHLLEALALWEGEKVRAALCVDDTGGSFDMGRYPDLLLDADETPLYGLEWVPTHRRRRVRQELSGLGDFRDMHKLLTREVDR